MSTHNDKHGKDLLPEGSGVVVKPLAWFMIILTLATALVFVIVKGMTVAFNKIDAAANPAGPKLAGGGGRTQREPLLQGAPGQDKASLLPLEEMNVYRQQMEAATKAYGWVAGKENAEAHIPIERAKQLLLESGTLKVKDTAVAEMEMAEKTRKQLSNADASAGRMIGKQ